MSHDYWDKRGRLSYTYKGERFYTITPLPYYLKRRERLLNRIEQIAENSQKEYKRDLKVADFGSGDGYYGCWLAKKFPESTVYGFDISKSMVDKAKKRALSLNISNTQFYCRDIAENKKTKFDLLLILTVFQHFMDEKAINQKINQLNEIMKKDSKIILFEATAKKAIKENKLIMRPETFYIYSFQKNHFKLMEKEYISYPFFCMYQKVFLKTLKYFLKGTETEKNIWINKNKLLRSINQAAFKFGESFDKFICEENEGYTLFLFQKTA
ncbi:MAG: class I SAM-dependent methyltransferase [Acidobacteriota bacterium]